MRANIRDRCYKYNTCVTICFGISQKGGRERWADCKQLCRRTPKSMRWQKLWQPALFPCAEASCIRASNLPCGSRLWGGLHQGWQNCSSSTYLVEHARLQRVADFAIASESRIPDVVPFSVIAYARLACIGSHQRPFMRRKSRAGQVRCIGKME